MDSRTLLLLDTSRFCRRRSFFFPASTMQMERVRYKSARLQPGTEYFYQCGDPAISVAMMLLVGDVTYANLYLTNCTGTDCYSCSYMEPVTSTIPMMVVEGNHEIELQIFNKTFASYRSRFAFPSTESGSFSPFYYSFDTGGIHFITLAAYADYNKSGEQYEWLEKDLAKVDRSVTPCHTHQENVITSMENVMKFIIDESEDIQQDMPSCLLQDLASYLLKNVTKEEKDTPLDEYSKVVTSLFQDALHSGVADNSDAPRKDTESSKLEQEAEA
ncbi:hypothetical protein ABZP36_008231 [Zizania latifolia]